MLLELSEPAQNVLKAAAYIIFGCLILYGICLWAFPEAFAEETDDDEPFFYKKK